MNDDFFENGKPVHKISYCAFLDVLGFSARTRESYLKNSENNLLQEFFNIFANQLARMKEETEESLLYFKSFSDNVLLAHPRFSRDMESEFGFIIWSIQEYQLAMALKGFFIRGGLSVGRLFVDEDNVYGEALIDAYELESKVAINPMVVLCDKTMKLVDKHLTYYYGDWAPQLKAVLVNSDGRYFINYLSECVLDSGEAWGLDVESLGTHRDRINEALLEFNDNPNVFSKFKWLSDYHNYFCDSVSGYPNYSDTLKVSDELSITKFRRLDEK